MIEVGYSKKGLGIGLILLSSIGWTLGVCVGDAEHVLDTQWPEHARFHALQLMLWLIGLNLAIVVVAIGPLFRGEGWASKLLLVLAFLGQGSYFLATYYLPGGAPAEAYATPLSALNFLLFLSGLLLARD